MDCQSAAAMETCNIGPCAVVGEASFKMSPVERRFPPPVLRAHEDDVPALDAESGRGLFLVETLSQRWGWYPTKNPEGKVTWCEISAPHAHWDLP